jgi:DNA primase
MTTKVYTGTTESASADPPERRGVSITKPIQAAKETVPVEALADRLTGPGQRRGREIAFLCPLHDDHNPSLRVDAEKGVWFCDPCLVGGDVVRLAQLAWGIDRPEVAAAEVLIAFGHEPPQRPPSWFRKQERQRSIRDGIRDAQIRVTRQRLYRRYFEPLVLASVDEEDRARDEQELWEATRPLAEHVIDNMMGARR